MLKKLKSLVPNVTTNEMKAIRSLKLKNIRILQADKGNCTVVLDQYE